MGPGLDLDLGLGLGVGHGVGHELAFVLVLAFVLQLVSNMLFDIFKKKIIWTSDVKFTNHIHFHCKLTKRIFTK